MAEEYQYSGQDFIADSSTKLKDLEEKYRVLKDRTLLIGQNLIDMKESNDKKILSIKKDIEALKNSVERLVSFIETASQEFSKFARKEDVDMLYKQAKMFQPLEFATKKDLEKLKNR